MMKSSICISHENKLSIMKSIFEFLLPFIKSNWLPQRVIAASIFAEFINHSKVIFDIEKRIIKNFFKGRSTTLKSISKLSFS